MPIREGNHGTVTERGFTQMRTRGPGLHSQKDSFPIVARCVPRFFGPIDVVLAHPFQPVLVSTPPTLWPLGEASSIYSTVVTVKLY